jgi:PAS domain S-box-containing protein
MKVPYPRLPKSLPQPKRRVNSSPARARQMREAQARLAAIVESSDDAIIGTDPEGIITTWNQGAERLFGYRAGDAIGQSTVATIIPPERAAEEEEFLARIRRGERVDHYETLRRHQDGRLLDVSLSLSPIKGPRGRIIGIAKILRDVTDRNRQQDALQQSEARMRAIVNTAVDAIVTIDERGIIDSVNPATERLFGYTSCEMIGRNVSMLMPEPYRGEHDGYMRSYVRTGLAKIIGIGREVIAQRKDGTTFPISLAVSEMRMGHRRMFTGIVHDLTGRRHLERQVLDAATHEQRRIGHDLHDGVCQELAGLSMGMQLLARRMRARGLEEAEAVLKLDNSVRSSVDQVRKIAHGLNPVDVDAGGLAGALENLAFKITETTDVRCDFYWDQRSQAQNANEATQLYRIAQEALGNAMKHGKAKRVDLRLGCENGFLILRIEDDGIGLPPESHGVGTVLQMETGNAPSAVAAVAQRPPRVGMGLQTMSFRARMLGGTFDIRPGARGGTVVTCSFRHARG